MAQLDTAPTETIDIFGQTLTVLAPIHAGCDELVMLATYPAGHQEIEHVNEHTSETWHVLAGTVLATVGAESIMVRAGARLGPIPPGVPHKFAVSGGGPASVAIVAAPGHLVLRWLRAVADVALTNPTMRRFAEVNQEHGLTYPAPLPEGLLDVRVTDLIASMAAGNMSPPG